MNISPRGRGGRLFPINEDNHKNEDDSKMKDTLKNEDDSKKQDDPKKKDLINEVDSKVRMTPKLK